LHAVYVQTSDVHAAPVACATVLLQLRVAPHVPQLFVVSSDVSQPLAALPSQSP
jgi:hypothetical protein